MLPNGEALKSVYLDEEYGILAGVRKLDSTSTLQRLLVECGTIETATIKAISESVQNCESGLPRGSALDFIDAPVSGGPNGARCGTLAFMVIREPFYPGIPVLC